MTEAKVVVRAVRFTIRADSMLEKLADTCNRFNLKVNGNAEITPSLLLCHIFEKLAHKTESRSEDILQILTTLEVKTPFGKDVDIDLIRSMVKEISQ